MKTSKITWLLLMVGMVAALVLLFGMPTYIGVPAGSAQKTESGAAIMDQFDMYLNNQLSEALDGVVAMEKSYWLNDADQVAPEPDQSKYGETDDPSTLGWLLEDAKQILGGQELYFNTDIQLMEGTKVMYYLDDTIFAITWKQEINRDDYTFSEVKIAHPSQFRRFLAGGEYGSEKQFTTTEMAESVNAVVASSGDFYRFRRMGTIVYEGKVQRINSRLVDTCFIDDMGNMNFVYAGDIQEQEEAQKYCDENNIRFSVSFGPVLVDNGVRCEPERYDLGQVNDFYPRAALCQMGNLHYLLGTANSPNIHEFAEVIAASGCEKAYALDGGQTAVIVMNDQMINTGIYGPQRKISDIIYFATAVPDGQ